jgi:type 1 glutamine amidotransferase
MNEGQLLMSINAWQTLPLLALWLVLVGLCSGSADGGSPQKNVLRVVVVTGGHDFDRKAFPRVFEGYPDLVVTFADQKDDSELFEDISGWDYDVIVFYNMGQKISEKRRGNLLTLLDRGVGVVAMHHCIAAYAAWPEWARIIGGKYFEKSQEFDGSQYPPSVYHDDVPHGVIVADTTHPVTAGVRDFPIVDETYKGQWIDPHMHLLLRTDVSVSDKPLAWAKSYHNARVCYIQLGHGPSAYPDANFRKIVVQAIRWAAKP